MLVSAAYDGDAEKVVLKFYDPRKHEINLWMDDTGHKPYCYSKSSIEELSILKDRKDILEMKTNLCMSVIAAIKATTNKPIST